MWGTFSCLPGGRGVEENQPNTTNVPIWGTLVVFGCGCSETRKRVPYGTHFHVWMGCGIRVGRGWGGGEPATPPTCPNGHIGGVQVEKNEPAYGTRFRVWLEGWGGEPPNTTNTPKWAGRWCSE